jgi:hypothetical protein
VACLLDDGGFAAAYGVRGGDGVIVRPDGYLGLVAHPLTVEGLADHLRRVAGAPLAPATLTAGPATTSA